MPVDIEKVRDAFSKFEADDYVGAKEILQQEIHQARDEYLKDKLGLEKSVEEACAGDGTGKGKKKKKMFMKEGEDLEESDDLDEGWGKDYMVGGVAGSIAGSRKRKRTQEQINLCKERLADLHDRKAAASTPEQKESISQQIAREQGKIEALRNTYKSQDKAF